MRCNACRKKDSKLNNKIKLLNIACNGQPYCFKCSYNRSPLALNLIDAVSTFNTPTTIEEKTKHAANQFVLCNNCKAETEGGEYSYDIISIKPVVVEFYYTRTIQVKEKINIISQRQDSNVEIVTEAPKDLKNARRIIPRISE
jgi:hypothetical protein